METQKEKNKRELREMGYSPEEIAMAMSDNPKMQDIEELIK